MGNQRKQQFWAQGLIGLTVGLLAALAVRLLWVHSYPHPQIVLRGATQYLMRQPILARRGMIVDRKAEILAGSVERRGVFADPGVVKDLGRTAWQVAPELGLTARVVYERLIEREDARFIWLKRQAEPDEADAIDKMGIYGIGLTPATQRHYPMGSLAAHLVGFVGVDNQGLEGLEHQFDAELSGRSGYKVIIRDAAQRPIGLSAEGSRPPADGDHLVLTLDSVIQTATEDALADACLKFEAQSGSALVMDPFTGEILAWSNWPTYNPRNFRDSEADHRRNRLITDPIEPGSIFKPLVVAGAIQSETCTAEQVFDCSKTQFGPRALREYNGKRYGAMTVSQILIKSSNVGMGHIGTRLGNERLHATIDRMGFGRRTGIDLPGEDPGLVHPLARWTSYSTTSIPMGQEISATPLQVLRAYCAIANGGYLLTPRVVMGVIDPHGEMKTDQTQPIVERKVFSPKTADLVREMLGRVVKEGTGRNAALQNYRVFGKTGTAQVAMRGGGGYEPDAYVASFVGGAPIDRPRVMAIVNVNRPSVAKGYYGGLVAAPAVRYILRRTLEYLQTPPDAPVGDQLARR